MTLGFWDLGREPGPSSRSGKSSMWALASMIILALLAVYAAATSSRLAFGLLLAGGLLLFLTLMNPRVKAIADQSRPRMHQTLDLPVPFGALPRAYRGVVIALLIGCLLLLAFFSR